MIGTFPQELWTSIIDYAILNNLTTPKTIFSTCKAILNLSNRIKLPLSIVERTPTVLEMFRWLRHTHTYTFKSVAEECWHMNDELYFRPFIIRTTCQRRIRIYRQGSRRKLWIRGHSRGRIFLCPQILPLYLELCTKRNILGHYTEDELILATIKFQLPLAREQWYAPLSKILFGLIRLAELYPSNAELVKLAKELTLEHSNCESNMYSDHEDSDDDSDGDGPTRKSYSYVIRDGEIVEYDHQIDDFW